MWIRIVGHQCDKGISMRFLELLYIVFVLPRLQPVVVTRAAPRWR